MGRVKGQNLSGFVLQPPESSGGITAGSGDSCYCGVRCETAARVAKLAPSIERLTGSVAPKSRMKDLADPLG